MLNRLKEILETKIIKAIIFGETHGFFDDNRIQEEIISIFKPDIFLYEMLEETELDSPERINEFLSKEDSEEFSIISNVGELRETIKLAKKYGFPIKGMDIKNMLRKDKSFLQREVLTDEEMKREEEILFEREDRQKRVILDNIHRDKKIFASTGAYHLREDSPLRKLSSECIWIYPIYDRQQIFEPPANVDIKKIKWGISIS